MKILLTGSTGQIGYELAHALRGVGDVVAVDRRQMDLGKLDQVRDVIRTVRPQLIVNPAAYTAVDLAESEPELAMRINAHAPAVMAEEAKRLGAAMIHYSSDYVFDGNKAGPYTEEDSPNPQNVYGRSKLAGEQAVQAAGIPCFVFRTSWVYGLRGRNFLLTVKRLAEERKELRIVADQVGTPTWCRTIAEATQRVVARLQMHVDDIDAWTELSGLYHLTAQGQTSWHGFAQEIVLQSSLEKKPVVTPIETADYPSPAKRPKNSVLSSGRFMQTFGDLPHWREALKLCLS